VVAQISTDDASPQQRLFHDISLLKSSLLPVYMVRLFLPKRVTWKHDDGGSRQVLRLTSLTALAMAKIP
jgi:hypothetical protein